MITAFHMADRTASGPRAVLNLFHRNRIRVEHLYCDSVALKSITYERFRGRVNWTSVDRFIGGHRNRILCREETALPADRGYRRYESDELRLRLCENAALYLLRHAGSQNVRVVLIDDTGEHAGLCAYLIEETDRVSVVTKNTRLYLSEADRLLEEKGAVLTVGKSCGPLRFADLVIAPAVLTRDLHCADDALILSAFAPTVAQNAPVISDYTIDLPEKYSAIKPAYLDDMYFACAMYSLAGAHELGASIFRRCSDGGTIHTRSSLIRLLQNRPEKHPAPQDQRPNTTKPALPAAQQPADSEKRPVTS